MVKLRAEPPPRLRPNPGGLGARWRRGAQKREGEEIDLRLGVHDSSRVEWTASVGLPEPRGARKYELEFTVEIPAHLYSVHIAWDHKQTFTRLQSPNEEGQVQVDSSDLDELRRDTLGVAHRLGKLRDEVDRTCAGAAGQLTEALMPTLEGKLTEAITNAVDVVEQMRRCLHAPDAVEGRPEQKLELRLADEYLSHQLLDFLGKAQKSLDEVLLGPSSRLHELEPAWTEELRCLLAEALAEELVHRTSEGYVNPEAQSPRSLARFVERASMLKKHFQDVLFLDVEAYMVDHKLRNWTGIIAASLAAAFWLSFTLMPIGPGARASISVGIFCVLSALAYALKDRIKELTRGWLAGRLVRLYGQRSVTLRLPQRLDAHRRTLVEARETFDVLPSTAEDVLNRDIGRTLRVMRLVFCMKCDVHGSQALEDKTINSIKHVFRYDVTPFLSRLDDAVKPVPVLDAERRVRFVQAPKEYRFPVRVVARRPDAPDTAVAGMLVLSKRGIERLEPSSD